MKNSVKIIFPLFIFSCLNFAQSYLIIQSGNSIYIPLGSQFCSNNIIVEEGASYITENISGTCESAVITGEGEILFPVELISFTAEIDKENNVLLKWETATEVNNYGFDIERSYTDKLMFEKIGFVAGHGNLNSKKSYSFIDKLPGIDKKFYYRLKQINTDGSFSILNTLEVEINMPRKYFLFQNYPNPFNPSTKIKYQIPTGNPTETGILNVQLKVYDLLGNEITTLVNKQQSPGEYEIEFDGTYLSSGIYFYQLASGYYIEIKKMTFVK